MEVETGGVVLGVNFIFGGSMWCGVLSDILELKDERLWTKFLVEY